MQVNLLRFDQTSKFLYLDFETFNLCLNFCHNLPWQASMLSVQNSNILQEFDFYIKWDTELEISEEAARINHYNHETVLNKGQDPKIVFDIIYSQINSHDYIVGHNVLGFDIYLLYEWYKLNGKNPKGLENKFIDTNLMAKAIKLNFGPPKNCSRIEWQYKLLHKRVKGLKTNLKLVATELGIDFDEALLHNSLYDLRVNKQVFEKLKFQIEI